MYAFIILFIGVPILIAVAFTFPVLAISMVLTLAFWWFVFGRSPTGGSRNV